jgi:hypothetical protein
MHSLHSLINQPQSLISNLKQVTYTTRLIYVTPRWMSLIGQHNLINQTEVFDRLDQILVWYNKTVLCHNNYSCMTDPSDNKFTHLFCLYNHLIEFEIVYLLNFTRLIEYVRDIWKVRTTLASDHSSTQSIVYYRRSWYDLPNSGPKIFKRKHMKIARTDV